MPDATPTPVPAAAPAPAPAAKQSAPKKTVASGAAKMSPEQKLDAILMYLQKQDRRERRRAVGNAFRQLLSIIYLGAILYGGWYLYQNQDSLMDTLLKKSTDYALQAAQEHQGTGSTVKIQLDDSFMEQLTNRLREQGAQQSAPQQPPVQGAQHSQLPMPPAPTSSARAVPTPP